ncbi:MAG TPA: putative Ig domain-containing protein, partial [Vulgatibacter sp.]
MLPVPDGTDCVTDDLCAYGVCQGGECIDVPKDCGRFSTACGVGVCNPADGSCVVDPLDEGTACWLTGLAQCEVAACDGSGACMPSFAPAGTACGLASLGNCESASCDGAGTCGATPAQDGTACNDGNPCSFGDSCTAGSCSGTVDLGLCLASLTYYEEGFEDCASSGWEFYGTWACGLPTSGPGGAFSGVGVIATNLSGNYADSASFSFDHATSMDIDLGMATEPALLFRAWFDIETNWDGFLVSVSNDGGSSYTQVADVFPGYNGAQNAASVPVWTGYFSDEGWREFRADLSAYAGQIVRIRFAFASDGGGSSYGAYIDDLKIVEKTTIPATMADGALPNAYAGHLYFTSVPRLGGSSSATWTIASTTASWLSIDPSTGRLEGTPGLGDVGPFTVTVRAEEQVYTNEAEATFTGRVVDAGAFVYYVDDFESCGDWTLTGEWECGMPTHGPAAPDAGAGVLATGLGRAYVPNVDYASSTATSPAIDLSGAADPTLLFRAWLDSESSYDGFNLRISTDGTSWTLLNGTPAYHGEAGGEQAWTGRFASSGWRDHTFDLGAYAGQVVYLRFSFRSDTSGNYAGAYVDSLRIMDKAANPLTITTSALPNGKEGRGYLATMRRQGGTAGAVWSIVAGTNHGWLDIDPATGLLHGTPGVGELGPVTVTIRVEEPTYPANFDEVSFEFEVEPSVLGELLVENFSSCAAWTLSADWSCGEPSGAGPSGCNSPGGCMATNIAGYYTDNMSFSSATADSPLIDLTAAVDPKLSFYAWVKTEGPSWDAFNVKIRPAGGSWVLPPSSAVSPAYTSSDPGERSWGGDLSGFGWRRYTIDISSYVGQVIQLRFAFRSDGGGVDAGAYIDDLSITESFLAPVSIATSILPDPMEGRPYLASLSKAGGSPISS